MNNNLSYISSNYLIDVLKAQIICGTTYVASCSIAMREGIVLLIGIIDNPTQKNYVYSVYQCYDIMYMYSHTIMYFFFMPLTDSSKPDTRAVLESLWGGKKTATRRQLRPIIEHSNQLKQEASPSVKQCLEVYERPTAHDRYTGKVLLYTCMYVHVELR